MTTVTLTAGPEIEWLSHDERIALGCTNGPDGTISHLYQDSTSQPHIFFWHGMSKQPILDANGVKIGENKVRGTFRFVGKNSTSTNPNSTSYKKGWVNLQPDPYVLIGDVKYPTPVMALGSSGDECPEQPRPSGVYNGFDRDYAGGGTILALPEGPNGEPILYYFYHGENHTDPYQPGYVHNGGTNLGTCGIGLAVSSDLGMTFTKRQQVVGLNASNQWEGTTSDDCWTHQTSSWIGMGNVVYNPNDAPTDPSARGRFYCFFSECTEANITDLVDTSGTQILSAAAAGITPEFNPTAPAIPPSSPPAGNPPSSGVARVSTHEFPNRPYISVARARGDQVIDYGKNGTGIVRWKKVTGNRTDGFVFDVDSQACYRSSDPTPRLPAGCGAASSIICPRHFNAGELNPFVIWVPYQGGGCYVMIAVLPQLDAIAYRISFNSQEWNWSQAKLLCYNSNHDNTALGVAFKIMYASLHIDPFNPSEIYLTYTCVREHDEEYSGSPWGWAYIAKRKITLTVN